MKDGLLGIYCSGDDIVIVAVKKRVLEAGSNFYQKEIEASV
jgi:hypothetical protein